MNSVIGLTASQAAFLAEGRVGRLATVDESGQPYLVPVCYVYLDGCLYSALDEKPKTVDPRRLKRVRNILANPRVALVVDRYSEEWSQLAYVSVRGRADLLEPSACEHDRAIGALREKYQQYRAMAIHEQPLIRIRLEALSTWGETEHPARTQEDFLRLIKGRRSVRWYEDRPVAPDLIQAILEAGRWAPSPHGRQPWRFVVLTRPERKRELAAAMSATWQEQLGMDEQPPDVIATRLRKSQERLTGAPVIVILCLYLEDLDRYPDAGRQTAETTMAIQSLGAAAQNMLLTAYALGLDGGWMCAPLFCPEIVCSVLGLSPTLIPHALLTFGYPAKDPVRRPRRPLDDLIELYD